MVHFVEEKVSSKLPLIFSRDETWNCWLEVFDAWEVGELIGDDGTELGLVLQVLLTNITKTNVVPTLVYVTLISSSSKRKLLEKGSPSSTTTRPVIGSRWLIGVITRSLIA
jgi:hypothetical protein